MPVPDPLINPSVSVSETSAEGIARLGRDKVNYSASIIHPLLVSAESLTTSVKALRTAVNRRTRVFTAILVMDILLTIAVSIIGWRSETFLACQVRQNTQFREAAATERAAQRRLLDVTLSPASTPLDRINATHAYYASLVAADQQRAAVRGC